MERELDLSRLRVGYQAVSSRQRGMRRRPSVEAAVDSRASG